MLRAGFRRRTARGRDVDSRRFARAGKGRGGHPGRGLPALPRARQAAAPHLRAAVRSRRHHQLHGPRGDPRPDAGHRGVGRSGRGAGRQPERLPAGAAGDAGDRVLSLRDHRAADQRGAHHRRRRPHPRGTRGVARGLDAPLPAARQAPLRRHPGGHRDHPRLPLLRDPRPGAGALLRLRLAGGADRGPRRAGGAGAEHHAGPLRLAAGGAGADDVRRRPLRRPAGGEHLRRPLGHLRRLAAERSVHHGDAADSGAGDGAPLLRRAPQARQLHQRQSPHRPRRAQGRLASRKARSSRGGGTAASEALPARGAGPCQGPEVVDPGRAGRSRPAGW